MKMRSMAGTAILLMAASVHGQDSENPPTLKLDRIPSLPAFAGQTRAPAAASSVYSVETVAENLSTPWALAFLPEGEILVSEYTSGAMRVVGSNGELSEPLSGLPEFSHAGWAGLFDLTLDPDFADNRLIYFSYTAPSGDEDSPNIPRVARGTFDRESLHVADVEVLLDGTAWQELHFAPDGKLLASGTSTAADASGQASK